MSYTGFLNIALTALVVALSALIAVTAVVGIFGFRSIRESAIAAAKDAVTERLADIVKEEVRNCMQLGRIPDDPMQPGQDEGINTGVTRDG
ncbi:hypothetical protein GL267_010205 [Acidithiobacillus ferrianus]|uniref:Uncharacterized protein n=2 Tax=Acidithiobacillus ferrianus TaxID=2678518 RepID=A0A845U6U2_9PROT|nr:hypothetical protein [Acidithiobacillus ferrianus]NDU42593.1 hypothetical protein [Acidithiobacillus ferrianus]